MCFMAGGFQWLCRDLHCQGADRTSPATLFATHCQYVLACLSFDGSLVDVDALPLMGRSGLPGGAVGGFFIEHGRSVRGVFWRVCNNKIWGV